MAFSQKLKSLREDHNVSQPTLGSIIGVSKTTISNWERGAAIPNIDDATKIAEYFKITVDELLERDEIFLSEVKEQHGYYGVSQAKDMLDQCKGLFFGGELSPNDMDSVFQVMTEMYFDAKKKAKKYTPKKYKLELE